MITCDGLDRVIIYTKSHIQICPSSKSIKILSEDINSPHQHTPFAIFIIGEKGKNKLVILQI